MLYSNKYPKSVFRELQDFPYSKRNRRAIFDSAKGSEDLVQRLKLLKKLPIHNGCVNCICWNEKGNKILSGSDDQHLIITDPFSYQVLAQYRTYHRANIFSAKFLPNTDDTGIVSCCGDGSIFYTDLNRIDETRGCLFNCHAGTTYDVVTIPNDPNVFLSCGEDYTVRSFDLRVKNKCSKAKCKEDVIIQCQRAVTALTVNSLMPCQIAIGCADSTARIYDRRMVDGLKGWLSPVEAFIRPGLEKKPYRITSLNFSPEGEDLLVSYSSEHVYLFGLKNSKEMVFSTESSCNSDDEEGGIGMWCSGDKAHSAPIRRLRLRGDWSDTGPDARPHSNTGQQDVRRVVQGGLIQRMTNVLSSMLNDPGTRAALSQGGEAEASDQVQLEDGLEQYLEMDRRPRQGSGGDSGGTAQNQDGNTSAEVTAGDNPAEPNMETPVLDESRESVDVNMDDSRAGCGWDDISLPEVRDPSMDVSSSSNVNPNVSTSSQPIAPSENRSLENFTSMETENPADVSQNEPVEMMTAQDANHLNLTSDDAQSEDDHISPLKRAKDERSSPFHDRSVSMSQVVSSEVSEGLEPSQSSPLQENTTHSSGWNQTSSDHESSSILPNQSSYSDHNVPSTSRAEEDERGLADSSRNSNLTHLTDELSSMFNGFKEKYGKKPMVNLVYSVRGSTASTISMSTEDSNAPNTQANQETVPEVIPDPPEGDPIIDRPEESEMPLLTNEEVQIEPSTSTAPAPEPSSSYTPSRFAVRMEKELCKAIRKSRGEDHHDESVRLKKGNIRMKYVGHRNARTMIKEATFWGSDYVMSGSDCGHVFIWTRDTGRLVMTLQADNHVVNCLQPHPTLPILATSGIDYDLKLWAPLAPEPTFDFAAAQELMNRNAIMLEQTKDTITVPASFMIRMLACLNQLRRGGARAVRRRRIPPE